MARRKPRKKQRARRPVSGLVMVRCEGCGLVQPDGSGPCVGCGHPYAVYAQA